jgi:Ni,Fe-hydrogenase III small subunit
MSKLISIFGIFPKIFFTRRTIVSRKALESGNDVFVVGQKINKKIKKNFKGSLAIREVDAGSTNACEQELTALTNTSYDIERFGIHFVASPRHADMLMVTGPVSRNMKEALIRTYNATPEPKIVVAVGDDARNGGIFKGSNAVLDGVDKVIPVNYYIPGDPPSPKIILSSLLKILEDIDEKLPKKLK